MKLLIDMNLLPRWVEALSQAKIEVVHWASVGDRKALDTEIMLTQPSTTTLY